MKEKRKDCLYCGNEMKEVKTVRKKFCSDLCRVNFNNEVKSEKQIKEILSNPIFNKIKREVFLDLLVKGEAIVGLPKLETENKTVTAPKKEKQVNISQKQKEEKFEPQGAAENGMPVKTEGESAIDYKIRLANWKEQLKNK